MTKDILSQNLPIPGVHNVQQAVIKDMRERAKISAEKYGSPLMTFNGRDALVDAYQEALDLAIYLKQRIMEIEYMKINKGSIVQITKENQAAYVWNSDDGGTLHLAKRVDPFTTCGKESKFNVNMILGDGANEINFRVGSSSEISIDIICPDCLEKGIEKKFLSEVMPPLP